MNILKKDEQTILKYLIHNQYNWFVFYCFSTKLLKQNCRCRGSISIFRTWLFISKLITEQQKHILFFLSNNWNITVGDKELTLKYSSNQAFSWPWQWVPLWTCPGSEWPSRPPRWFSPPPSWCTPTHCSHPKTSDSHSVSIVSYLDWY